MPDGPGEEAVAAVGLSPLMVRGISYADLHVCGNHASWRSKTAEDLPDYVDVAVAAPAKINDYRALGYILIFF